MSVTQKQIAQHLGVSQSLVAHALKGYERISPETRRRVEEAARELGYDSQGNAAARLLRARRSGGRPEVTTLAVLMGDFFEGLALHEIPFYKPIFQGMKQEAQRRGIDLSYFDATERLPRVVVEGGMDGVISLYSGPAAEHLRRHKARCPVLRVGDGAPTEWVLRPDDFRGIYLATQHLIQLGHRRIAYLGDLVPTVPDVVYKCRLDGYLQALKDGGVPVYNELVEAHINCPSHEAGATGMARLLERGAAFTAVVCFNDASAWGAMQELQRRGIRIPHDLSITGSDDGGEVHPSLPGLTTIHWDRVELGRRAVEAICEAAGQDDSVPEALGRQGHELLPVRLMARASTGLAPA